MGFQGLVAVTSRAGPAVTFGGAGPIATFGGTGPTAGATPPLRTLPVQTLRTVAAVAISVPVRTVPLATLGALLRGAAFAGRRSARVSARRRTGATTRFVGRRRFAGAGTASAGTIDGPDSLDDLGVRWTRMPGPGRTVCALGGTRAARCRVGSLSRCFRRPSRSPLRRMATLRVPVGRIGVGSATQECRQLRRDPTARGGRGLGGGCFLRGRVTEVPACAADQQHCRRGEEHQREAFDQRIAAVDQDVLHALDLRAVHHVVRAGNHDEQDQRRLDDRGEHPGSSHREHCGQAAEDEERGEEPAQLLPAGVEGESDQRCDDRDEDGTPPGNSWDVGVHGAVIGRYRRPRALS